MEATEPERDDGLPPARTDRVPLLEPRDGLPPVVERPEQLRKAIDRLAHGRGPVAFDAERASGYRYGQRAYLVQLRRCAAGTYLVDPIAAGHLGDLGAVLAGEEWVLHAASQDLPCLAEVGLVPTRLFDTELAGRLLGHPRVALGTLVAELLGYTLEKGHAAADWSTRPLPPSWLAYAALDVELLVDLRDRLEHDLAEAGKLDWAREEFAALLTAPARPEPVEPWRRTSGIHKVRSPRGLAVVRSLWERRDQVAREHDQAPGRVLPDAAIVAAAVAAAPTVRELATVTGFTGRGGRSAARWHPAVAAALALPEDALPGRRAALDGAPPSGRWADRQPEAAARLTAVRQVVATLAERHTLPAENLLPPAVLRQLAWEPPAQLDADGVAAALRGDGAREWQVGLTAEPLHRALVVAAVT